MRVTSYKKTFYISVCWLIKTQHISSNYKYDSINVKNIITWNNISLLIYNNDLLTFIQECLSEWASVQLNVNCNHKTLTFLIRRRRFFISESVGLMPMWRIVFISKHTLSHFAMQTFLMLFCGCTDPYMNPISATALRLLKKAQTFF